MVTPTASRRRTPQGDPATQRATSLQAKYWVSFFKLFSEGRPKEEIEAELSNIARKVRQAGRPDHKASMLEEQLLAHLSAIVDLSLK